MRNKIICFWAIFCLVANFQLQGQEVVNQVQPSIMIIPYVSSSEDALVKYEGDAEYRLLIDKIANHFDQRGFSTIDFKTELENAKSERLLDQGTGVKTDLMTLVKTNSPADIHVETEIIAEPGLYNGRLVRIRLKAIDKYSSMALATAGDSDANAVKSTSKRTNSLVPMVEEAMKSEVIEDFLNILQSKFSEIVENGRTIKVRIKVNENCQYTLSEEIGDDYDYLSDIIIEMVKRTAFKGYHKIRSSTKYQLYFDQVKIPLRDANGNNYNAAEYGRDLRKKIRRVMGENGKDCRVNANVTSGEISIILE